MTKQAGKLSLLCQCWRAGALASVMLCSAWVLGATAVRQAETVMPLQAAGLSGAEFAALQRFDATPESRGLAMNAGRKASFFCANCHGVDGNSRFPDVPNLASQHPGYLFSQIRDFESGARKNAYMQGLIKMISEDDRLRIVYYFANSTARPRPVAGDIARGRLVFQRSCSMCHGGDAHGMATIPRLAGQPSRYLALTLDSFREHTGERVFPPMSLVAGSLSARDLNAVIAYLSSAK